MFHKIKWAIPLAILTLFHSNSLSCLSFCLVVILHTLKCIYLLPLGQYRYRHNLPQFRAISSPDLFQTSAERIGRYTVSYYLTFLSNLIILYRFSCHFPSQIRVWRQLVLQLVDCLFRPVTSAYAYAHIALSRASLNRSYYFPVYRHLSMRQATAPRHTLLTCQNARRAGGSIMRATLPASLCYGRRY